MRRSVASSMPSRRAANWTTHSLSIYIVGDNGASAEGGLEGTVNEMSVTIAVQK
jgi:hypothetical protein